MDNLIATYEQEVRLPLQLADSPLTAQCRAAVRANPANTEALYALALAQKGLHPVSYTPNQVKLSVVGYGGAEKKQVMEMTKSILHLTKLPRPDDAADALALAICHGHSRQAMRYEGLL